MADKIACRLTLSSGNGSYEGPHNLDLERLWFFLSDKHESRVKLNIEKIRKCIDLMTSLQKIQLFFIWFLQRVEVGDLISHPLRDRPLTSRLWEPKFCVFIWCYNSLSEGQKWLFQAKNVSCLRGWDGEMIIVMQACQVSKPCNGC